jgi:DNA processing protein
MKIQTLTIKDIDYPKNLRNIHRPPKQLYVNGAILPKDEWAVAIVGSRRASQYGIEVADRLGYELAVRGVTVVSGMARGIDTAAHRGALRAKGRTIAVMGSGHGNIYPPENAGLYKEIAATGAVVTEFEDSMEPLPYNFPQRNRIISGLSLGVVVVEAAKNSGALITADLALEQGREVFAVPGKISSVTSSGTNDLLKDGAKLIQSAEDIIEDLKTFQIAPLEGDALIDKEEVVSKKVKAYVQNSLTDSEKKIYSVLSDEPKYIDQIFEESALGAASGSKALLSLELKRLIKELPGKQFVRKENKCQNT